MGFAEGFGKSFSASFENQRQRSHERETDQFRYRMEDLIKRRDKYDEWKRQDSQYMEKAKTYVEITGQPPEAVGYVYNMFKSGTDDSVILKTLQGGSFNVEDTKEVNPANPVDEQMSAAGLGQAPNPAAQAGLAAQTAGQAAPSFDGGGLLSQIFPGMKKFSPNQGNRINNRVMQTTGMTQAEIDQVDAGYQAPVQDTGGVKYTPNPTVPEASNLVEAQQVYDFAAQRLQANPDDPKAKADFAQAKLLLESTSRGAQQQAGMDRIGQGGSPLGTQEVTVVGPDGKRKPALAQVSAGGGYTIDGQPVDARVITEDEKALSTDIQTKLGERALKQNDAASNIAQAYTAFGNARAIITENPRVLQEMTAGGTKWIVDLGKEFQATGELIGDYLADPVVDEKALPALQQAEQQLTSAMNNQALDPAKRLAAAKGLINAQYAIAAYHLAAAKGQEGRGLSETERKMFTDLPNNATDPQNWDQLVGSILVPTREAIDKEGQIIPKSHPMLQSFQDLYGYSPVGDFVTVDQYLEGTAGADLDRAIPKANFRATTDQEGNQVDVNPPSGEVQATPVTTQEEYDALPPGTTYRHPDGSIKKKK